MCSRYRQMYWSWRGISSWKTNSLYLRRHFTHADTHTHTLSSHTPELLQFPWPPYWPCVLSGSRALAGHGASKPAEWGRRTSPETWTKGKGEGGHWNNHCTPHVRKGWEAGRQKLGPTGWIVLHATVYWYGSTQKHAWRNPCELISWHPKTSM